MKTVNGYKSLDWCCPDCGTGNVEDNSAIWQGDIVECKKCKNKFKLNIPWG